MTRELKFQDPGEGIHEGEVLEILVSPGDEVAEGDDVLVVETDKASYEVSSRYSGTIEEIFVEPGDMVHVGDRLMSFGGGKQAESGKKASSGESRETGAGEEPSGEEASSTKSSSKQGSSGKPQASKKSARKPEEEGEPSAENDRAGAEEPEGGDDAAEQALTESSAAPGKRPVPATPATRRLAREKGVDLRQVEPSGKQGRVLQDDVRAFAEGRQKAGSGEQERGRQPERSDTERHEAELPDFSQWGPVERQPLRSIRRQIARRMTRSWSRVPHVTHQDVADITELERFRQRHVAEVEKSGGKLTLTVLMMKAVVAALREYPRFNASLDTKREELVFKQYYDIGVALDTERGLLVPVVRDVVSKSMSDLAVELVQIAERARAGELDRNSMRGGTFTITNVGPLGGTGFTPIINYPEVAILGMARAELRPVVRGTLDSPEMTTRLVLPLSLGFDHRVNDGADAARFVNRLIEILADPERLAVLM